MDRAKAAVSDFMSKSGKHDTTVHERVAPHVQNETINEQHQERRQVAVDREVHQDHYHTSVQPVKDREVLPEQHHHNLIPVEHRTHDHRDHDSTKNKLQTEAAQFKDTSVRAPAQHTSTTVPSVGGEHVHHHVHETIQPIVQKETVEPHVTHTTVPIHEVHHEGAKHHTASALPAVHMADFKKQGGSLTGRDERVDHFDGEPKGLEKVLGSHGHHHEGHQSGMQQNYPRNNENERGVRGAERGLESATGAHGHPQHGQGLGSDSTRRSGGTDPTTGGPVAGSAGYGGSDRATSAATGKPSLMDKLNPMKDADGDGKKGFMK